VNRRQIHVECEIETLENLATNCIVEIKSNTEVIQLLDDKGEEVRKGWRILRAKEENKYKLRKAQGEIKIPKKN